MRTLPIAAAVLAVVATAAPRVARADDRAAAKAEFAAGLDADKRKDYDAAIEHYQRAYDLAPHQNALYNIAVDYERTGELRDAATFYGRYLDEAGPDTEDRDKVTRLIDNLRRRPSHVTIRTNPAGGDISIDGQRVGPAPVERDLAGGAHAITATLGERKTERQITVEYAEPGDFVLALADQQGSLIVTSNVDGAQVEIDGEPSGVTPLTIAVAAGDRKVVVHSDGYSSLERLVRVPAEGSAQITATLVHPVGYTAPPDPLAGSGYVISAAGGAVMKVDTNLVSVGFGYRIRGWEAAWLISFFGEGRYGYGLVVNKYIGDGRFKPYLGGFGQLGATSMGSSGDRIGIIGGHAGIALELLTGPKGSLELDLQAGAAYFSAGDVKELAFPLTVGIAYRGRRAQ